MFNIFFILSAFVALLCTVAAAPLDLSPGDVVETVVAYELVPFSARNISSSASAVVASATATSATDQPTSSADPWLKYWEGVIHHPRPGQPALNLHGDGAPGPATSAQPRLVVPSKKMDAPAKDGHAFPEGSQANEEILAAVEEHEPDCPRDLPALTFVNLSEAPICYMIEANPTVRHMGLEVQCGAGMGLSVRHGQIKDLCLEEGFAGAVTGFRNQSEGFRFEFNFEGPKGTWYDADAEMGICNSTLGPLSKEPRLVDGLPLDSTTGEQNAVVKANEAFQLLPEAHKSALAESPRYIKVDDAGNVTGLKMDKAAPFDVRHFFQGPANLTGYFFPGSVRGVTHPKGSLLEEMKVKADSFSWYHPSRQFVLMAYP